MTAKFRHCWKRSGLVTYRRSMLYNLWHAIETGSLIKWIDNEFDINNLLPYLGTYMAHSRINSFFYYIHLLPRRIHNSIAVEFQENHSYLFQIIARRTSCLLKLTAKYTELQNKRVKNLTWLTIEDAELVFKQPYINKKTGIRDRFIIALMYDSGCKDNDIIHMKLKNIVINKAAKPNAHIFGKSKVSVYQLF